MLKGPGAIALGALVALAGCLGPGDDAAEPVEEAQCLLGGPPREPPPHREPFNLTEEHVERFPVLASLFVETSHFVTVDCDAGLALLRELAADGADVAFRDQPTGHDVYLSYEGTTLHVVLTDSA